MTTSHSRLGDTVVRIRNLFSILQIVLGILIFVANAFLLYCFGRFKFLDRKPNVYIFSLCISDLLCGVVIVQTAIINYFFEGSTAQLTKYTCVLACAIQYIVYVSSMLSMLCATAERTVHIVYPFTHARFVESHLHAGIVVGGWLILAGLSMVMAFPNQWQPGITCYVANVFTPIKHVIIVTTTVLPPLIINVGLMIQIGLVMLKHRRQIAAIDHLQHQHITSTRTAGPSDKETVHDTTGTDNSSRRDSNDVRISGFQRSNRERTAMVGAIGLVTVMCWLPLVSSIIVRPLAPRTLLSRAGWAIYREAVYIYHGNE